MSVVHDTLGSPQAPSQGSFPRTSGILTKPHPGQKLAHDRIPIFPGKTLPSWGQALLSQDFELLCRDGIRLLNEGQVSSEQPTQLLGVVGPSHLSPGWELRAIPGLHQPEQGQDPEAEHTSKQTK